jgi:tetratricopeptide (TPR) repeat protein
VATKHQRLLLIGLDGLGHDLAQPAIEAGLLPALGRLVASGASGGLISGVLANPAVAWTTLATGQRPDRHGVMDGMVFDPVAGELRPVDGRARRTHALWNLASREGRSSVVVGWAASHPADPIRGAFVSDRYFDAPPPGDAPWVVPEGALHPPALAAQLAELRLHPGELEGAEIAPFVPRLAEIDQGQDRRLTLLASALAETVSRHAVATRLLAEVPWSFAAIRYPLLDRLAEDFLRFRGPSAAGIDAREARIYGGVIDAALRLLDNLVAYLVHHADGAHVVVCSPFGVRSVPGRGDPGFPGLLRHEHGFVALAGERIAADGLVHGAATVDVVPTLLTLMGLPRGTDLPGRVLREAFAVPPLDVAIRSWETLAGDFGRLDPTAPPAAADAAEDLVRQLLDLGLPDRDPDAARVESNQRLREEHALAITHLRAAEWERALPLLERVVAARPIDGGLLVQLAWCHFARGDHARCRELADRALRLEGSIGHARLLRAVIALRESRRDEAAVELAQAEATGERGLGEKLAQGWLLLGRLAEAERGVERALAENPESAAAFQLQATLRLARGEPQAAAEAALGATGRCFHFPAAHTVLGMALAQLGRFPEAAAALARSITQGPSAPAHRALAQVLAQGYGTPGEVRQHLEAAEALERANAAPPGRAGA